LKAPLFFPHFISLGPSFSGSNGISGVLDWLCGSHYLLKSGDLPCSSKVIGFILWSSEEGCGWKEPQIRCRKWEPQA
jgi:hypothetical protein